MQRLTRCLWVVVAIGCAVPNGAFAQKTLTWQQVREQFAATNPTLQAGRIGIDEATLTPWCDEARAVLDLDRIDDATADRLFGQ